MSDSSICNSCEKSPGCRTLPMTKGEQSCCIYYKGPLKDENSCRILAQNAMNIEPPAALIEDSGDRTEFDTGAVRDMHKGKGRMDLLPWQAIMEVSKHCERGADKYGERNIDKGIPMHSLLDSGVRHIANYLEGKTNEPHLVSACWNLLWALQFELTKPELQDIPNRRKENGGHDNV